MSVESWEPILLNEVIREDSILLGRGNIISSKDIAEIPGSYPIYSSSAKSNGEFGRYGNFMFDEELITWSIDGGGRFFYRPKHKFSVTNVCGYMRVALSRWDTRFVYYLLDLQHKNIAFDYQTKAHPSVIRNLYFLVRLPIEEQTQIAAILSTIDRAIEQTEAIIAKQQRIKTGLMQDLLTKGIDEDGNVRSEATHEFKDSPLGQIPVEWEIEKIGDVFDMQLGKMLSQKAGEGKSPFPYLGNKNIQWDYVDISELLEMDFNPEERQKFKLLENDILVCEGGEIGRTCLWRMELKDCYFQKAVHRLRPKRSRYAPSLFPRYMRHLVSRGILNNFTSQTSIAHLTKEKLITVPISVPRNDEQRRIVELFDQVDELLQNECRKLENLRLQKTGLMQDLLTGNVRVTALLNDSKTAQV